METAVLLLSDKKSMLVSALADGLEGEGLHVTQATTDKKELAALKEPPSDILLYLQNETGSAKRNAGNLNVLEYIKKKVVSGVMIRLFLLGTDEEIREAEKIFPPGVLADAFVRPYRTDEVADAIRYTENVDRTGEPPKSVLVVDDDATMLRTLKASFSAAGYKVYTANSGMNAIQLLIKTKVDLILLDYEMPIVKGPQIFEMIRSEEQMKDIPIMFLTAKGDRQTISEVLSLNPESYLLKSLPQSAIVSAVDNFFLKG